MFECILYVLFKSHIKTKTKQNQITKNDNWISAHANFIIEWKFIFVTIARRLIKSLAILLYMLIWSYLQPKLLITLCAFKFVTMWCFFFLIFVLFSHYSDNISSWFRFPLLKDTFLRNVFFPVYFADCWCWHIIRNNLFR